MAISPEQRRELGVFIRSRREALQPADVGQPTAPPGRRRTPGLRREEIAQLSGISTTWYSWLEQGREISLSAAALARLAETMHLNRAERHYVFDLAGKRDPVAPAPQDAADTVSADLVAAIEAIANPAYLLDRLWRARAWNAQAAHLFEDWLGSTEPNLLRYVFLNPAARTLICDWENRARRLLAEFRADTAHNPDDAAQAELIGRLMRESPDFARFWNTHAVLAREGGARRFNHPWDGRLEYEQVTLLPAAQPDYKFVILLPRQPAA